MEDFRDDAPEPEETEQRGYMDDLADYHIGFSKPSRKRLTRYERLEAAADAGYDTWEEYRD